MLSEAVNHHQFPPRLSTCPKAFWLCQPERHAEMGSDLVHVPYIEIKVMTSRLAMTATPELDGEKELPMSATMSAS